MRKYFTIILLIFLVDFSYSQFGATKYVEAEIIFKNGDVLNGFARAFNFDLEFKDSDKKNRRTINFMDIKSVNFTVYDNKKKNDKHNIFVESLCLEGDTGDKTNYVLAELIVKNDKVKIYGVYFPSGGGFSMGPGVGGQISMVNFKGNLNLNRYSDYYCFFNNETTPKLIYEYSSFKTFRIMASECFKDCKELSDKIKSKEFTKDHIFEIAGFYNDNCR
ncbi:hypothetical protein [Flavobacterium sp. TSSA_36]|uniref:hypothetical protein n=1 Tax=Flavobacterium sp. TSSA_36 TaxID=3447669 RepID=UPI003F3C58B2